MITPILQANIAKEARLITDKAHHYTRVGRNFADHGTTNHKKGENVSRAAATTHTNTVEG